MSSKSAPLIVFIVVMVALIAGMLLYKKPSAPMRQPASQNQTAQITPVPTSSNPNALPPGTSDTQLNQDSQTLDQSMTNLNSDMTNVDLGLNDQQTNLQ